MQENFIFKLTALAAFAASLICAVGCSQRTPEQIAAENAKKTDIAVRRSKVFLFDEKPQMAIEMLEKTYAECGASPKICEALADSYAQDGQMAQAAMFYDNAADLKNGDPELQINAAKCYEQSGVFDSAVKAYSKYLKLKPQDMVAWKSLAKCLEKQEKYSEALNAHLSALKAAGRNPTSSEAASIGLMFAKVGNAPQARRWLEAAYKATIPENIETRRDILLGLLTVYLSQKEAALVNATVSDLDKIDPNLVKTKYPALHAQLQEFYKNLREAEEAIKAEAIRKEAEAKAALEKKALEEKAAKEKAEKEKADAAAKAAEAAKSANSASTDAKTSADVKSADGDPAGAKVAADKSANAAAKETAETLANAEQAKANGADRPDTSAEKSAAATDAKFGPAMEETIQQADIKDAVPTGDEKKLDSYEECVADCYDKIARGQYHEAEQSAHKAIYLNRHQYEAWRALAKAYEAAGKYPDSYMAAREAYVRNADDINANLYYLRNASRVQNNEKFLNSLYRAHEKFPNNSEILVGLARTYKVIGDKRNATYFYNLFLNTTPQEHPLYKEMRDELEELLSK